jgi:FKBP-type peptidyl-prolyl cis-trans isomerase
MKSGLGFLILFILPVLISCGQPEPKPVKPPSDKEIQESLIRVNRELNRRESGEIDAYVSKSKLNVTRTGTGLRYEIYKHGNGQKAQAGMTAQVRFSVSLLDGKVCYSSDSSGAETFLIDHDEVESGLHEGIKLMREGDRAKFILPSHLAHGLIGDRAKIPARSPIVYDIELIQLKK